jgi:hypothetical protein
MYIVNQTINPIENIDITLNTQNEYWEENESNVDIKNKYGLR